ncbi:hypothetical protein ALC56_10213 [Trachymyrmex septentrionalis]|uniref:Uncharacterized protein n=1 Tax=Trachymyrmex septentrionalis TaxID=34720 RepID=A0A195F4I4_9HYME|nr:hypothetical protein ALC56_10213 [Trachymyrmex septentrionalis]
MRETSEGGWSDCKTQKEKGERERGRGKEREREREREVASSISLKLASLYFRHFLFFTSFRPLSLPYSFTLPLIFLLRPRTKHISSSQSSFYYYRHPRPNRRLRSQITPAGEILPRNYSRRFPKDMKNILQYADGGIADSQWENIRRSVFAEASIPRIEYGTDGEHQRQYDHGYPLPWIEAASAVAEIAKMTQPDKEKYYAR